MCCRGNGSNRPSAHRGVACHVFSSANPWPGTRLAMGASIARRLDALGGRSGAPGAVSSRAAGSVAKADTCRVELDLDGFGVRSMVVIGCVRYIAAGVSDTCLDYPRVANQVLHPPEATAGEHSTFKLACHDASSFRLHLRRRRGSIGRWYRSTRKSTPHDRWPSTDTIVQWICSQ